jgi:hypothetical protein
VGLFVVCGLGVGGRVGWLARAEAQSAPQAKSSTQDKIKQLEDEIARLKQEIARAERPVRVAPALPPVPAPPAVSVRPLQPTPPVPPQPRAATPVVREVVIDRAAGSEYDYVLASEMTTSKFTAFLRDREAKGWEYKGEATLQHEGKAAPHWVFRKASKKEVIMLGDAVRGAVAGDVLKLTIERVGTNSGAGVAPFVIRSSQKGGTNHSWYAVVGD